MGCDTFFVDGTLHLSANAYYRDITTNDDVLATVAMCTVEVYLAEVLVDTLTGTDDPVPFVYDAFSHRFLCAYTPTEAGRYTFKFMITVSESPVRRGVDWGAFTVEAS